MKKFMAIILTLVMITIAGCSGVNEKTQNQSPTDMAQKQVAKPLDVVVATLKGPTGISMIKMIDGAPTLGDGVKVKYDVYSAPEELTAKLVAKQVDFATIPTNQAALLYNKMPDYQLAATSIWGVMYIVSSGEKVESVTDLKGKTICLSGKGNTPDIALRYILEANKLDPEKDVKLEYIAEHSEVAAKFVSGLVKHVLLPEPFATGAIMKLKGAKTTVDLQKEWAKASGNSEFPQTCLVVRSEFAKNNPDVVQNLLNRYKESIDWVNANLDEAGKLVEKNNLGLNAVAVKMSIPRCNMKYVSAEDSKNAVNLFLGVILKYNSQFVGGKLPGENFFYKK